MRDSVKHLRNSKCVKVNQCPGYYIWWFKEKSIKKLLSPLSNIDYNKLTSDGNGYVALYFGISSKPSSSLYKRARWHIFDKHTPSKVSSGTLSTLRQTLSALFGLDMTKSQDAVNKFMDDNCEWEWHCTKSGKDAENVEKEELSTNYYPLNIKDNKVLNPATALIALRKKYRQ